mgnify:CR=1 FL=1
MFYLFTSFTIFDNNTETITRRWGNSIAVIIPNDFVVKQDIKENEPIKIEVKKRRPRAGAFFGFAPELKRWSTQELKDEARKGWLSDSDREREEQWKKNQKPIKLI